MSRSEKELLTPPTSVHNNIILITFFSFITNTTSRITAGVEDIRLDLFSATGHDDICDGRGRWGISQWTTSTASLTFQSLLCHPPTPCALSSQCICVCGTVTRNFVGFTDHLHLGQGKQKDPCPALLWKFRNMETRDAIAGENIWSSSEGIVFSFS